nr:AAA family ATPase [Neopusillimonas maritima]
MQQHGHSMAALAPYGNLVRNLSEDGIPINTIASVLAATDKHPCIEAMGPKTVVVIDEAGAIISASPVIHPLGRLRQQLLTCSYRVGVASPSADLFSSSSHTPHLLTWARGF